MEPIYLYIYIYLAELFPGVYQLFADCTCWLSMPGRKPDILTNGPQSSVHQIREPDGFIQSLLTLDKALVSDVRPPFWEEVYVL